MTPAWQEFVAASPTAPTILSTAPADALLVLGGRIPPAPLVGGLRSLMPEGDLRKFDQGLRPTKALLLGLDPWREVGRALLA
ncbi:MAG: hypothetical protein B7Z55_01780, partial [Planctomycetales bacterium 12-60-4]